MLRKEDEWSGVEWSAVERRGEERSGPEWRAMNEIQKVK